MVLATFLSQKTINIDEVDPQGIKAQPLLILLPLLYPSIKSLNPWAREGDIEIPAQEINIFFIFRFFQSVHLVRLHLNCP